MLEKLLGSFIYSGNMLWFLPIGFFAAEPTRLKRPRATDQFTPLTEF